MMRCPILPVGPGVTETLPVRPDIVAAIRKALADWGYPVPGDAGYTPELARLLYQFQVDHPFAVGGDLAVSLGVRGPNGQPVSMAGCGTYVALGIPCEGVDCQASLWDPFLPGGYGAALGVCATIHYAAQQGLISLDCPAPSGPPEQPQPQPSPGEAVTGSPWLLIGGVALLALLAGSRGRGQR